MSYKVVWKELELVDLGISLYQLRVKCEGLKRGKLENSVARNHERTIAEVESVCGELLIEEFSSQFGE